MSRFIDEADRLQGVLLPETIDDYVPEESPVRVIDAFVGALDIASLGFEVAPKATGRPGYHPATMLKIYLYGYLNRIQSSRRLEQEARRNLELMWLVGRLAPDFKTIAGFRAENALLVSKATESERRDEPPCSGVQHEASDEHDGNGTIDRGAARLIEPISTGGSRSATWRGSTRDVALSFHTASAKSSRSPASFIAAACSSGLPSEAGYTPEPHRRTPWKSKEEAR